MGRRGAGKIPGKRKTNNRGRVSYAKKDAAMKPMFIAFFAIIVIAVGASFGLGMLPFSAADTTSSNSVRLAD